jgi:predicted unusual protein kinase regulating ubiquinone biosynthesis (AarF/ABC1/UbiB family)
VTDGAAAHRGLKEVPLRVGHLKRYKDLARLIIKYSDAPIVRTAGIGPVPETGETSAAEVEKAEAFAQDLERMGPTFVKLGQVLSTRPDLLPPPYLEALARLQESVKPVPWEDVERVVQDELGVRLSKAFTSFEETPLASASLGQVHRAMLRDGRAVAVKVQRPGIQDSVRQDLDVLLEVARLADEYTEAGRRYAFTALMEQFQKALLAELDYRQEAQNLETLSLVLEEFPHIVVPRPVADYTTSRVLTMDLVLGRSIGALSPLALQETDGRELLDELFRAYLKQALVEGIMHADPHPGNVFLTDDGRLALIDLGMVLHIAEGMRKQLVRLLIALADGDDEQVVEVAEAMGDTRSEFDRRALQREVATLLGRSRETSMQKVQMGRLVMGIARLAGEHGLRPPPELALVGKTLLNLDGIAARLDPDFDPAAAIRRHSLSLTERSLLQSLRPSRAFGALLDAKDFAEELPRRVSKVLDAVGNKELEVKVHLIDDANILTGIQQMANRITTGLVLAAMIVGAALIMNVETTLTLFGYPVLAILFFLAAAFGGGLLLWRIWKGDREAREEVAHR